MLNIYLVALTFILLIVVVYMSENITTAVLIISLMANFLIICSQLSSIDMPSWDFLEYKANANGANDMSSADADVVEHSAIEEDDQLNPDHQHMYGPEYDEYHVNHTTYTSAYPEPQPVIGMASSELTQGVDASVALMAQHRFRAKKAMDGAVSKTSDYYKHHFGDELERSEAKPWWGNQDY